MMPKHIQYIYKAALKYGCVLSDDMSDEDRLLPSVTNERNEVEVWICEAEYPHRSKHLIILTPYGRKEVTLTGAIRYST